MKKVKVKIPAKINLSLYVTGVKDGYHTLSSVVASINVYNKITAKVAHKNSVRFSNVKINGESNAEKALNAFTSVTNKSANVKITSKIPVGQGLGSSSADIAGTLKALDMLYKKPCNIEKIANELGSDTAYMLKGGFARISGRGEIVESLSVKDTIYLLIVTDGGKIGAKECYKKYDEITSVFSEDVSFNYLLNGETEKFLEKSQNDLYIPATKINNRVKDNLERLKGFGYSLMTGSGSAVFSAFLDKKQRDTAYKKLKKIFKKNIIKAQTI